MRTLAICLLLPLLTIATRAAAEEEAVTIYRTVHPSVVGLANIEGNGTGVILDHTGLILTNAHVISSPLPYTCTVDIARGDKVEKTVKFKRVRVVGIHPTKDLALVRIDPKEHGVRLSPAARAKAKAIPGQRVYALGNPAAGGQVLNKTITSGLLSGVDRLVEGNRYYQVDAAINPGNSGGPLVSKEGEVLGIVTLKFTDVENVGFAIPIHDLKASEFVSPKDRKPDPQKAVASLKTAHEFTDRAYKLQESRGAEDEEVMMMKAFAAYNFHSALAYDPANPAIYYNCGNLLRSIGKYDVAIAYLMHTIELDPWFSDDGRAYREMGLALIKLNRKPEAELVYLEGIAKHPLQAPKCREDLAILYTEIGKSYEAVLQAAVLQHLKHPDNRMDVVASLESENLRKLSANMRKQYDREVASLQGNLQKKQQLAKRAKSDGKGHMTASFNKFIAANGMLGDEDDGPITIASAEPRKRPTASAPTDTESPAASADDDRSNEGAAASAMRIARKWEDQGRDELAKKWLRKVVDSYPDTEAAREARSELGLPQPKPKVSAAASQLRTWSDPTGKFRIEAKFRGELEGQVRLEKKDGELITVPLGRLSNYDQAWLRSKGAIQ